MTDTHPYATRSRIRNAGNTKVIQGPGKIRKNNRQKNQLSNGDSNNGGIKNKKKEEVEDYRLGLEEIKRDVAGEMSIKLERRMPYVEVERLDELRMEEEIKEHIIIENEKKKQLKAEEERIQLQLQLEEERRERLLLEELRLKHIRAEEENQEKLRIEQEKLENLQKENQLMKERLEKQKLEVEKYQPEPSAPMVLGQDEGTNTNCCPTQETTPNNGVINVKHEILLPERKSVSATEKGLKKLEEKRESYQKWKKTIKTPSSIRRKLRNDKFIKLLVPKSGVAFLNEFKPGCTYSIYEQKEGNNVTFVATVENEGKVIAVGHGSSKMLAKKAAAENAIRILITGAFKKNSNQELKNEAGRSNELDLSEISWTGLASYAMHKMFTDWQNQGNEFSFENFIVKKKSKNREPVQVKRDLPPGASKLNPAYLLNLMIPGLGPVELQRNLNNNVTSMTIGYKVNGTMYTGTATSKKKAKLTAAKAVLTALYGINYED